MKACEDCPVALFLELRQGRDGSGSHLFYDYGDSLTRPSLPHEQIQLLAGQTAKPKLELLFAAPKRPWGHWVLILPKSHMRIMSCGLSVSVRLSILLSHLIARSFVCFK